MSSSNKNDSASKSNNDGVCEVNDMLQNMTTTDEEEMNTCANCGEEGSDVTNTCNKCKSVMYCNAACKKKHKKKHKKQCERIVAELHDEALFKQPPILEEDCPICFLRMPTLDTGCKYKSCCGKVICGGCIHAVRSRNGGCVGLCPFCRTAAPKTNEKMIERFKKRVEIRDSVATYNLGLFYAYGECGLRQDYTKALEFYHLAAEIGYAKSYCSIGHAYDYGRGVEVDKKKARHYYELAAMQGDSYARHNLGCMEEKAGNIDRAIKHHMIASRSGDANSLKAIQQLLFTNNHATKEDYLSRVFE